jgi:hypothetical protein
LRFPAPTREAHLKFCKTEGWDRVRSARGKSGTHHDTFELPLPNGDVLRTRVSRPPDRSTYGPGLWSHILKDQLHVTEQEFWACVQDGVLPDRGSTAPEPADGVPTEVLWQLIHRVGLSADQVARLTKEEAIARLQRYWTTGD